MLTNFKKNDFICSIETYEEWQQTVNTDQISQQLNKRPEGIVIKYGIVCNMYVVDKSYIHHVTLCDVGQLLCLTSE